MADNDSFCDVEFNRRTQRDSATEQSRAEGVGKISLGHAILDSDQSESHRHSRLPTEQSAHPVSAFAATTSVQDVELSACVEIGIHIYIGIETQMSAILHRLPETTRTTAAKPLGLDEQTPRSPFRKNASQEWLPALFWRGAASFTILRPR
jgi:hypothetical protein